MVSPEGGGSGRLYTGPVFDSPRLRGNTVDLTETPTKAGTDRRLPPQPYAIAIVLILLSAVGAAAFALWPPDGNDHMRVADVIVAVGLVVAAALVWRFGPRSRNDWVLDAVTMGIAVLVAAAVSELPDPVGQAVTGYGLVLFAVFAAYFRPMRLFLAELFLLAAAWAVGIAISPQPLSAIYFLVAVAVMTTTSVMVAVLAGRLRQQACYDSLTGALNRRGLELMAPQTQALANRSGLPVTVGLIDLDEFKVLNDQLGHAAGDRLLVEVSAAWHTQMRRTDLIARYGGDEFAVIFPGSTEETAAEIERRANEGVDASWCIGFTRWHADEDLDAALARADRELYRAKAVRKGSAV